MNVQHSLHLAIWIFLGAMLLGSHVWNAFWILVDRKKPRA